jgi:hypothetical protein
MRFPLERLTGFSNLFAFAMRVAIAWLIFSGPVYGLAQARLESTATFSNGAGIVLISALQRAKSG